MSKPPNFLYALAEKYGIGQYPKEYNQKIHGPFDPARYYGKPDTPLKDVKLSELTQWFGRRNFSPLAMARCVSRGWWRYQHKWMFPKGTGIAPTVQIVWCIMIFFYVNNMGKIREHKNYKYHW